MNRSVISSRRGSGWYALADQAFCRSLSQQLFTVSHSTLSATSATSTTTFQPHPPVLIEFCQFVSLFFFFTKGLEKMTRVYERPGAI